MKKLSSFPTNDYIVLWSVLPKVIARYTSVLRIQAHSARMKNISDMDL
jgi:hypothetical protein